MPTCSQGHASVDTDYCSECGVRIGAAPLAHAPSVTANAAAAAGAGDICADCATPRAGASRYCEVCRYDFQTKATYASAPVALAPLPPAVPAVTASAAGADPFAPADASTPAFAASPMAAHALAAPLNIEVVTDPALADDAAIAAQCPKDAPVRVFPLDLADNLVGRRSDVKGVFPEIQLDDPGVSRRHLKLIRQADGSYAALELGSTNGTVLHGVALVAGVLTPLKPGDELFVGSWTKLRLAVKP